MEEEIFRVGIVTADQHLRYFAPRPSSVCAPRIFSSRRSFCVSLPEPAQHFLRALRLAAAARICIDLARNCLPIL
jgi:hypothetical protein